MSDSLDALKEAYAGWYPSFLLFQLTPDRKRRYDSMDGGKAVDLPSLPHGDFCKCAFCQP